MTVIQFTVMMQTVPPVPWYLSGSPQVLRVWQQTQIALSRQEQAQTGAWSSTGMQSSRSGRTWKSLIKARLSSVMVTYTTSERKRNTQSTKLFLPVSRDSWEICACLRDNWTRFIQILDLLTTAIKKSADCLGLVYECHPASSIRYDFPLTITNVMNN